MQDQDFNFLFNLSAKNGKQKKGTLRKNKIYQIIVHSILGSFEGKIFSTVFAHKKRGNNK